MQNEINLQLFYPNPFNPAGVEFELTQNAEVTLEVFDEAGDCQKIVFEKKQLMNGTYRFEFNSFNLQEGIYTVRLIANTTQKEFRVAKKIFIKTC